MMDGTLNVFKVLSHPIRVKVLLLLSEEDSRSYTEILEELDINTGKLNFHLSQLEGYIKSNDEGYFLTEKGIKACTLLKKAKSVKTASPAIWRSTEKVATPKQRLKSLTIDASLFVGLPLVVSLLVLLSIPVQLNLDEIHIYLLAGWNPIEHIAMSSALLLTALTAGEAYNGRTPGKFVVGIRVLNGEGPPKFTHSLIRNVCTVYLLPIDFVLARALGMEKVRLTDEVLNIKVVEDEPGDDNSGLGGAIKSRITAGEERIPAS